jgi:hypothetical protein
MSKPGPEAKLIKKMRTEAQAIYGDRLVTVKYHGSQYGEAGVSDLLCVLDGIFVACEVKAPESYGGSVERALAEGPTLKQRAFMKRVEQAGGITACVATVDGFLETLGRTRQLIVGVR